MTPTLSLSQLQTRRERLEATRKKLKQHFVGIDAIIDGVLHALSTWYCLPGQQDRSLVISLWGMTGTGKTSLVQELVAGLGLQDHYHHFDIQKSYTHPWRMEEEIGEAIELARGGQCVLAFDEFQHARTVDEHGLEVGHPATTIVWQLLGGRDFQSNIRRSHFFDPRDILTELEFLLGQEGIEVKEGKVVKGYDKFLELAEFSNSFNRDEYRNQSGNNTTLISNRLVKEIFDFCRSEYPSIWSLKAELLKMDGPGTLDFLRRLVIRQNKRKPLKSAGVLVFLIGNLDEAYAYSRSLSPSQDADFHADMTRDMPLLDARRALRQRFRPEQVARMGNNIFLYPALDREGYLRIIRQELQRIEGSFHQLTAIPIRFHASVEHLLMTEAVQPALGSRPVFTAIQRWIESCLGQWILDCTKVDNGVAAIEVSFQSSQLKWKLLDAKGKQLLRNSYQLPGLQVVNRRVPCDDQQASVAVHEAGHAVLAIVLAGKVPDIIYSYIPSGEEMGLVRLPGEERAVMSRQFQLNRLAIGLGGYAAELFLFGHNLLSAGASHDLEVVTAIAASMVKQQGLAGFPYRIELREGGDASIVHDAEQYDAAVRDLLDRALDFAKETLEEHREFLLALARRLADQPSIKGGAIRTMMTRYPAVMDEYRKARERKGCREILFSLTGQPVVRDPEDAVVQGR